MSEREEQIIRNLLIKSSKDNTGELIHKYTRKRTVNLSDLRELSSVMGLVCEISLFAGCREYLRLFEIAHTFSKNGEYSLAQELQSIAQKILYVKAKEALASNNFELSCEAILALYAIEESEVCKEFLLRDESPARYFYSIVEVCLCDNEMVAHIYDIVLFLLNAVKQIDDFSNNKCIRAIRFNTRRADSFWEERFEEICRLAKYYFEHEQYISLSALMRVFELDVINAMRYKHRVYEYIGIEKNTFLEEAFRNGTARALDFYFVVKYYKEFPAIDELFHILNLKTTASVFCIIHQCFRKIKADGFVAENVAQVLSYIKEGIKTGQLNYDFTDEFNDRGIENKLMKRNIELIFQMLCRNKQDVKTFLQLISYFNLFSNAELRLNYNITKDDTVRYTDWQQEYKYICERYQYKREVAYVVMNSYLRFYVDVDELFCDYASELKDFWFPGYITNKGKIKLFQERLNPSFSQKKYSVIRDETSKSVKKTPEELLYVRFKIISVDSGNKEIHIKELQSIPNELRRVISDRIYAMLLGGRIMGAYYYLKSYEGTEYNLYQRDRYMTPSKFPKNGEDMIRRVFIDNAEQYKEYLSYIYLNSFIKTFVSIDSVWPIFDSCNQYFLGNINLCDNVKYAQMDYYKISPNYYNPQNKLYRISKCQIPNELKCFIEEQLEMSKNASSGKHVVARPDVRICFYIDEKETGDIVNVKKIHLHCCEREITDLSYALQTYYTRISKINRTGIARSILKKYMNAYRSCAVREGIAFGKEWKDFFHYYLKYLHYEIRSVIENPSSINRWLYNGASYNQVNMFVTLQVELLNGLSITKEVKNCLEGDRYYKSVMEDLKSCQDMRFFVYDTTVFRFLFDSKEDFYKNIMNQ